MEKMLPDRKNRSDLKSRSSGIKLPLIKKAATPQPSHVSRLLQPCRDENPALAWTPVQESDPKLVNHSSALKAEVQDMGRDLENAWLELERHSEMRGTANEALRIILEEIEVQKKELEKEIAHRLDLTIRPTLDQLKSEKISKAASFLVESLESGLAHVFSSFGLNISDGRDSLTPREIRICEMISSGLSSKQVAKDMGVSVQTVLVHRKNVRKKLGLTKSKKNLAAFLRANLSSDEP